nr:MAG TPA: hypothetical protein [Caudoviricetes sp.]
MGMGWTHMVCIIKKMELLKMQIWHVRLQIRYYQTYMVAIK